MVELFDRALARQRRERAVKSFATYSFLFDWAGEQIHDRLFDVKREFQSGLQIGARGKINAPCPLQSVDISPALSPDLLMDNEVLPIEPYAYDLVASNLELHSINDLPAMLFQIRHALKPDGLFVGAMFGGETLHELRASLMHAEIAICGGASPRVMPFADKPQMGELLQQAGFTLPVIDSDIVRVSYPDIKALMRDIRGMGEASIIRDRSKTFMRRDMINEAERYYRAHYSNTEDRLEASFEIIFLIGWAPDASQQKPLKPGSATARLADILGTEETKL
jgi:SAM-dependent methyltransferase